MSKDAQALRADLVNALVKETGLSEAWRGAFLRVPRHAFLPDHFHVLAAGRFQSIDRATDPDTWLKAAYAEHSVVTQFDGGPIGALAGGDGDQHPTSSASQPSLVAAMLEELDVRHGDRVLEIGTGTGYNAALLADRLGEENVTTVELDEAVVHAARGALHAAGYRPHVIHGDGSDGHPPNAPYDRVIATCSVRWIPYAWVAQTRPGGLLLVPRTSAMLNYGMVRLTKRPDGTASGPFVNPATFMHLRGQKIHWLPFDQVVRETEDIRHDTTTLDPRDLIDGFHVQFALSLQLPDLQTFEPPDTAAGAFSLWYAELDGPCWARIDYQPGASTHPVSQHGPRDIWPRVEAAYTWWVEHDTPAWDWFGLTVTPEGQHVWYDTPDSGHTWPVPDLPG